MKNVVVIDRKLLAGMRQRMEQDGKYLFVYFWKQKDEQTESVQGAFQDA